MNRFLDVNVYNGGKRGISGHHLVEAKMRYLRRGYGMRRGDEESQVVKVSELKM